ncbi:MAG TPA: ComEC/Rec2 family competence protein [Candidatus Rifleibacterium sp.]|nr:ComEC/Rec2 family competence protein [Candidatus Rifleibacterium sp.]
MKNKRKSRLFTAPPDMLVGFTAVFACGLLFSALLPAGMHIAMLVAASCCLLLSFPDMFSRHRLLFLGLAGFLAAAFYGNLRAEPEANFSHFLSLDKVRGRLSGQFKGEFRLSRSGSIRFKLLDATFSADDQNIKVPGLVECIVKTPDLFPEPEQQYALEGSFSVTQPGRPPTFNADRISSVTTGPGLTGLAGRVQRKLRDGLNTVLPRRHAGIVTGFILGDTSQIPETEKILFRETGISHLLAVSGQHIMVIIVCLAAILHWLKVPPLSRSIMTALFLIFYAMTTTGSPSVWRALIMYLCVATILHTEAFPSPVRPVSIAALILLLYRPALIFNAAFQLSFTAVLSIVFLREPIERLFRRFYFPETFSRYMAITLAASFGTIPMTAMLFGTVSASSLLVNPLIIWSFSYILPVAFITAVLSIFWPGASIIVAPGLSLVLDGLLVLLGKAQTIPGQYFYVGNLPGFIIAGLYGVMLFLAATSNRRHLEEKLAQAAAPEASFSVVGIEKLPAQNQTENGQKQIPPAMAKTDRHPFKHAPTLAAMDEMLCECGLRPLKNLKTDEKVLVPLQNLSIDSQNLYHRISDLDRKIFVAEPERLLQSHIFLMALMGNEILNRISTHLDPPPAPGEIRIGQPVRDRYLAAAVLADTLLHSSILTRARSDDFMMLISRGQGIFSRARRQLERILENLNFEESIEQHFALRHDMLTWCNEFINYDVNSRQTDNNRLRPEQ